MSLQLHLSARVQRWRRLLADDPALVDAGSDAERVVALVRLAITGALFAIPLATVLARPTAMESYVGLYVSGVATLLAAAMYVLAQGSGTELRGLSVASGAFDVTMVSAALATYLVLDQPHTAVNSKVVFEVYFLAIGATCLRYDWRACVTSGAVAVLEYGAIVAYASTHWSLNAPEFAPYSYGMFSWTAQISRLILLAAATLLSTTIVLRARALRQASTRDRLTGLLNRGHFDEAAADAMQRAVRRQAPVSVALVDLDHFKQFNDVHGHVAGDAALRALARTLRAAVRPGDVLARYGGEEFVVLMPDTTAAGATAAMERLRRELAATAVELPRHGGATRVTASVGVASWPRDVDDTAELLHRADDRLFAAKRLGRNRVVGPDGADGAPDDGSSLRRAAGG
jgi:diguanylate cyclase (GGDEF)-like protein